MKVAIALALALFASTGFAKSAKTSPIWEGLCIVIEHDQDGSKFNQLAQVPVALVEGQVARIHKDADREYTAQASSDTYEGKPAKTVFLNIKDVRTGKKLAYAHAIWASRGLRPHHFATATSDPNSTMLYNMQCMKYHGK